MVTFPIVDSHVHLYDTRRFPYAWMENAPQINRPHLTADFRASSRATQVYKFVFIEAWVDTPHQMEEARWAASLVKDEPRLQGMVPSLALEKGLAVEEELARLSEIKTVKAVRRIIEAEPDHRFCQQPGFIEGVKLLAKYDFGFDLCVRHFHLPHITELVRDCPEIRFVLDHIGKPPIRKGEIDPWRDDLRALARLPNVSCKISGVLAEADHKNWTRAQLRPYIDHAIEVFGFDRIMFGSDWPVSELTHRYEEWVDIVEWVVMGSSETELKKLFRDNAISFYRMC